MTGSLSNQLGALAVLLRSTPDDKFSTQEKDEEKLALDTAGIRCPHCKWRPSASSRWTCWDCDFPEYFYGGCGSSWNTFETEGVCPTCSHKWKWTACLRCWKWALHRDWYE